VNKNLVIARIGPRSLHPCWIDGTADRNWDLLLLPYRPVVMEATTDWEVADVVPGPKWSGLRTLLNSWDGWRGYEHVWLPDDDILTDQASINRMFDTADKVGLDLFAPALHDASYFAHFSTMRNHTFSGRWTGFVEIMVPGFRTETLEKLLFTLDLTETGWGWGLDSLWPHLLEHRNVGVIDEVPVLHTRPVGQLRDADLANRVRAESDRIMHDYGCRQVHTTYAAFGATGQPLPLDPDAFFAELVSGWRHLIEADPRVLSWLIEFQRPLLRIPEYPVPGTPSALPGGLSLAGSRPMG
jgi:hypothetical protein